MAKKESTEKPVTRSVILQPEVDAKLVELAEKEERSISFMIARAVKEMVALAENTETRNSGE